MAEVLQYIEEPWFLPVLALLLFVWLLYRFSRRGDKLQRTLNEIAHERIDAVVIPNGDDGEIQLDYLLLTSQGVLILHIKDVQGTVFGSDKMQDWTVISDDRRYTFSNPQPALYDRIAAVRQIVNQLPVAGRVLFLEGGEFTKGVPGLVCNLDELLEEFSEHDKAAARKKIEAFKPHWDRMLQRTLSARAGRNPARPPH
ncbi:MAG: NERD domain-containing protein [Proteobacteria bacterium]|nr:NERD domain-containing protein [Pseudomonadota bacterium]